MAYFPTYSTSSSINQPKMRQEGFHLPSPSPSNGNPPSPPPNSNGSSFDLFLHSNSNNNNHSQSPPPLSHSLSHNRGSTIDFDDDLVSLMGDTSSSSHHGGLSVLSSERSTHLADHELGEGGLDSNMDHRNMTPSSSHANGMQEEYRPHNIFDMGAPSAALHFSSSSSHNHHGNHHGSTGAHPFTVPSQHHHAHRGDMSLSPPTSYSHHADTFGSSVGSIGSGGGRDGFTGHFNSTIPPLSSAAQHEPPPHDNFSTGGFPESPSPTDTMSTSINLNGVGSRPGTGISTAGGRSLSRSRSRTGSGPGMGVSRTTKSSSRRRDSFSYHRSSNSTSAQNQNGNTMAIFGQSNGDSPPGGLASPISPPLSATTPSFGVPPASRPQAIVIPSQHSHSSHHSNAHLRGPISPVSFGHGGHAGSPTSVSSITTTGTGGPGWFLNGSGSAPNGNNIGEFPLPTPDSQHGGMTFGNGMGISPKETHMLSHSLSSLHSHSHPHHGHGGHTLPTLNLSNLPPSGSGTGIGANNLSIHTHILGSLSSITPPSSLGALGSNLSGNGLNSLGGFGFGPNGAIHNSFSGINGHSHGIVGTGGSGISVTGYGGSNGIGGIASIGSSINGGLGGMGGGNNAGTNGGKGENPAVEVASKQAALVSEKRRRRRESHNAVERRRRDNINEKISELATLIPEVMLDPSAASVNANSDDVFSGLLADNSDIKSPISGNNDGICGSPNASNNSNNNPLSPTADSPAAQSSQGNQGAGGEDSKDPGPVKANKGMILRKSVDYIRYLQQLVAAQAQRNKELEKELDGYRSSNAPRRNATSEGGGGSFTDEDFININMGIMGVDMSSFGVGGGFGMQGLETMHESGEVDGIMEKEKTNDMDVDRMETDDVEHTGRSRSVRELRSSKGLDILSRSPAPGVRERRQQNKGSDDGDVDEDSSVDTGPSASLSASNGTASVSRTRSTSVAHNYDDLDEDERIERSGRDVLTKLRPRAGTDAGAKGSGKADRQSYESSIDTDGQNFGIITGLKERGRPGKRGSRSGSLKAEADISLGIKREAGAEDEDCMEH